MVAVTCCILRCATYPVELPQSGADVRVITAQHSTEDCRLLQVITRSDPVAGVQGTSNMLRNDAANLGGNAIFMHPEAARVDFAGRVAITSDVLHCSF